MPITLTSVPGAISPPTAPIWQSKAPTETTTSALSPSFFAHSGAELTEGFLGGIGVLA